jgi:hypothetical protein
MAQTNLDLNWGDKEIGWTTTDTTPPVKRLVHLQATKQAVIQHANSRSTQYQNKQ